MKESRVEAYMRKQAKKHGCLFPKFVSPANNGMPDRLLLHPSLKKTTFIELKKPGEVPRALQIEVHKKLRKYGAEVYVIDTLEGVDAFFRDMFQKQEKGGKTLES